MDEKQVLILKLENKIIKHRFYKIPDNIDTIDILNKDLIEKKILVNNNHIFTYNGNILTNSFEIKHITKAVICFNIINSLEGDKNLSLSYSNVLNSLLTSTETPNMNGIFNMLQNYGLNNNLSSYSNAFSQISENPSFNLEYIENSYRLMEDTIESDNEDNLNTENEDNIKNDLENSEDEGNNSEPEGENSEDDGDNSEAEGENSEDDGDNSEYREDNSEYRGDNSEDEGDNSEEDIITNDVQLSNGELLNFQNQIMNIYNNINQESSIESIKDKYKESYDIMIAMGFYEEDKILQSLQVCEGNVENAVNYYLSM